MRIVYIKLVVFVIVSVIILQSIVFAVDQATTSYPALTKHVLLPPDGDRANAFHMVIIGDSIAWGNGLNDQDKCYYLVADWLQKKLNKPVDVKVYAHSGAVISGATGNSIDPDLNSATPTLMDQANNIQDKDDVDLIWVSGGINDIDLMKVINVNTPASEIQSSSESIENPMENLLKGLLESDKHAKIVVTNYYPLISYDTKDDLITGLVSLFTQLSGKAPDEGGALLLNNINYKCRLIENSYTFNYGSTNSLNAAINNADNGANRIAFAAANFPPNRCYGTSDSWLWMLVSSIPPKTNDDMYEYRNSLCEPTKALDTLKILDIDNIINKINAMGHPNRDGAREYARAIESAIDAKGPNWLKNEVSIASMVDNNDVFGSTTASSAVLKGDIYYLPEGTESLPDFSSLTPVGSIYTNTLDIPQRSFTDGFPGITDRFEWFAIKYTGTFDINKEGEYAFRLVSDDGSRLIIDNNKIIDNDGQHSVSSASGKAYLTRGSHSIEVDYFQGPRYDIALQLYWAPPGETESVFNGRENNPSLPVNYYSGVATRSIDHQAWPFKLTLIGPTPDGSISGQIEWTTLNSINQIEGSQTANSITFSETAYIKKGDAILNCKYYLTPDGSSFKGTWDSCGDGNSGDITMNLS